jgi:amidase
MESIERREFLGLAATACATALAGGVSINAQTAVKDFELEEKTVVDLQVMMQRGQMSSRQITQAYLTRIADIDKKLNSIIEVNPDALAIADG